MIASYVCLMDQLEKVASLMVGSFGRLPAVLVKWLHIVAQGLELGITKKG